MRRWTGLTSLALMTAVSIPTALTRFVDGDEGFYLMAGERVTHGLVPYIDFFFLQAPGTPYMYGAWLASTGGSWIAARLLGALLTIATGLLVHRYVQRRTGSSVSAVIAVGIYATTVLAIVWLPLAKTYGVTAVCLMGGCLLLDRESTTRWHLFAGGFLAGLAVFARLPFVVALPVLVVFTPDARSLPRRAALIGAGAGVALIPMAVIAAMDPAAFWFGNMGFHGLRSKNGFVGAFDQKLEALLELGGFRNLTNPTGPQFLILAIAAAGAVIWARRSDQRPPLTIPVALSLFIVMLAPTPTHVQYMSVLVPLLVVAAADLLLPVGAELRPRSSLWLPLLGMVWLMAGASVLGHYTWNPPRDDLGLSAVRKVSIELAGLVSPGEQVLSVWPGYLLDSDAKPLPGLENQFALEVGDKVPVDEAHDYHLTTIEDVRDAARRGTTRTLVRGGPGQTDWPDVLEPDYRLHPDYKLVARLGRVEIFQISDDPVSTSRRMPPLTSR